MELLKSCTVRKYTEYYVLYECNGETNEWRTEFFEFIDPEVEFVDEKLALKIMSSFGASSCQIFGMRGYSNPNRDSIDFMDLIVDSNYIRALERQKFENERKICLKALKNLGDVDIPLCFQFITAKKNLYYEYSYVDLENFPWEYFPIEFRLKFALLIRKYATKKKAPITDLVYTLRLLCSGYDITKDFLEDSNTKNYIRLWNTIQHRVLNRYLIVFEIEDHTEKHVVYSVDVDDCITKAYEILRKSVHSDCKMSGLAIKIYSGPEKTPTSEWRTSDINLIHQHIFKAHSKI